MAALGFGAPGPKLSNSRLLSLSEVFAPPQVLYNNKGYHSMPTYLNSLNNAILRANLPKSKGNPAAYGKENLG